MIVVINGATRAGKDLFCKLVTEYIGENFCKTISSIDIIKELAKEIGWNGQKDFKSRKFLSDLKDLVTDYNDFPFRVIAHKTLCLKYSFETFDVKENQYIIFVHIREPEEIRKFVSETGAMTLLIRRAAAENESASNHADACVLDYPYYNFIIENNGTIEELKEKAKNFVEMLKGKN